MASGRVSDVIRKGLQMTGEKLGYCYFDSPVGPLLLAGTPEALHFISFPEGSKAFEPRTDWVGDDGGQLEVKRQLSAYFAGELTEFNLPLALHGTDFQKRVWLRLRDIPYGKTTSYGALAHTVGCPSASRAVGAANGANPIPIVLPCHRVVGSNGSLTGFGGGIPVKKFLLAHEARVAGVNVDQLSLL